MSMSSHQSARAKQTEWLTPPWLLKTLGGFDLDPCAPVKRPWPTAASHYTVHDNGLRMPWQGRVWLNPPFGDEWPLWVARLIAHGDGIALLHARTETRAFFDLVWSHAQAVCFVKGRIHFHHVSGEQSKANSGAPICLAAYGKANVAALRESDLGVVTTWARYA